MKLKAEVHAYIWDFRIKNKSFMCPYNSKDSWLLKNYYDIYFKDTLTLVIAEVDFEPWLFRYMVHTLCQQHLPVLSTECEVGLYSDSDILFPSPNL